MKMRDVMITPVICAEEWQTLAHIRRVMLLHEFTILPYCHIVDRMGVGLSSKQQEWSGHCPWTERKPSTRR